MIVAAAIKQDGKVWSVPKPGRHNDVFRLMNENGVYQHEGEVQGFLDDTGKFLNRKQAAAHTYKCKQVLELKWPPNLYSEDLW